MPGSERFKSSATTAVEARAAAQPFGGGFGRDLSNALFPSFLGVILLGVLLIWKFGSAAGNPNPIRALFIAMNAATLSGFNESPGVGGLNPFGQWTALLLIIAGTLFTLIVGGLAVIRIVRLEIRDRELIFAAFIVEMAALVIGCALLWDADRSPFQALFLAASSFGNCGLYVASTPSTLYLPVHAVILPLTVLGGLGIPVLMEIFTSVLFHAPMSNYSKTVLSMTAWVYVISLALIFLLNQAGRGPIAWSDIKSQLPIASVFSIESRTGGLPIASAADLTQPARWLIVVLMMIGASPGGAGGGLKCATLAELFVGGRKLLSGQYPGRAFAIGFTWLVIYLGLSLGAVLLLSYVTGAGGTDEVLFDAISALSNVGFTLSPVLDEKGIFFAYSAIILVGRMAPLMILWWMAETTPDAQLPIG